MKQKKLKPSSRPEQSNQDPDPTEEVAAEDLVDTLAAEASEVAEPEPEVELEIKVTRKAKTVGILIRAAETQNRYDVFRLRANGEEERVIEGRGTGSLFRLAHTQLDVVIRELARGHVDIHSQQEGEDVD